MVAQLLKLKARLFANGLRRSPWQLVGVVIGALYGLFIAVMLLIGLAFLGGQDPELIGTVLVLGVSLAVLGWALIPVLLTGVDLTLDPARFTTFTIPPRQLVAGLLLSGLIGTPGAITLILLAGQGLAWRLHPGAAAAAVLCGILATLLCMALARLTTTAATALTANRRFREISVVLLMVPLLLLGPIIDRVSDGFESALDWLPAITGVLGWTPLGSFAAVPSDLAAGQPALAAARFAVSLAYLAVIVWGWKVLLLRAMESPAQSTGGGQAAKGPGAFRLFPATPWGAVAARCLTYWLKDPRYAVSVVMVPLIPFLLWYWSAQSGDFTALFFAAPIIAVLMGFSISADISYDSTAFALHVATGLKGLDDRLGRVLACAVVALPVVLLSAVVPALLLDRAEILPAVLGMALGGLLTAFGVSSIASARFTYGVPQPGDSPFKTPPGNGVRMAVVQLAIFAVMGVLLLPEIGLMIAYLVTGQALYGWLALAAGLVLGAVFLGIGLRVGGRWWEARLPELMQATVANK
ncbi:transporter [Zafaria sp. J156]|uniref:transporter n=1 Tax=Zafaria sp. J156 TaxID=3116490 RepID=UPI002E78CF59|nr:transporter [Zafaria sp. J156]MEE1620831.1 transporter [Zafaria sp. J156]